MMTVTKLSAEDADKDLDYTYGEGVNFPFR